MTHGALSDVSKPSIQYWLFTLGNRNCRHLKMNEAKLPPQKALILPSANPRAKEEGSRQKS